MVTRKGRFIKVAVAILGFMGASAPSAAAEDVVPAALRLPDTSRVALKCAHEMAAAVGSSDTATAAMAKANGVGQIRQVNHWTAGVREAAKGGPVIDPQSEWIMPVMQGKQPLGVARVVMSGGKVAEKGCSADLDLAQSLIRLGDAVLVEHLESGAFFSLSGPSVDGLSSRSGESESAAQKSRGTAMVTALDENAIDVMGGKSRSSLADFTTTLAPQEKARVAAAKGVSAAVGSGPSSGTDGEQSRRIAPAEAAAAGGGVAAVITGLLLLRRRRHDSEADPHETNGACSRTSADGVAG